MTKGYVFMYRDVAEGVWDACLVSETRVAAFLEGGWRVLIAEDDIERQTIADAFQQQTQPFNQPRIQP